MRFKLKSTYFPKGDQPKAIKELCDGLEEEREYQTLLGVTGSGKTFTVANVIEKINKPTLIISHNKTLAAQLYSEFKTFFPDNLVEYFVSYYDYYQPEAFIPASNTYIEKDLSINSEIEKLRLAATTSLLSGRQDVIIVSSVSCIYGIGNPANFREKSVHIKTGMKISRNAFIFQLVEAQYSRTTDEFTRGTFRVKGDVVDIFPGYANFAIRMIFWGDTLEEIKKTDPNSNFSTEKLEETVIFPNTIFVTNNENLQEVLFEIATDLEERKKYFDNLNLKIEAKRIEDKVTEDIEMIRELGYCSGIENYSRYFDGRKEGERPFCLIDYFPKNFLLVVDESHVTLPQIRGMYGGDRSRKTNLVEYGFRLPAAIDNRPLKFEEFIEITNQTIFVSATPADEELVLSKGIVTEQVVRPTGLLDPEIEVRPTFGQVDDLMEEIRIRIEKKQRILVTTLTKKMAEELSEYFIGLEIHCKYLHSDIKTLERMDILRDLRVGSIDVLIGINLLREGLDLPEVSLVAILDADKEGFLRSGRSLTQTAGRAARNSEGKVIMYGNKITNSMQQTINETLRRREIQIQYNKKHKIIPKTIKKSTREIMGNTEIVQKSTRENMYDEIKEYEALLVADPENSYSHKNVLKIKINEIEAKMLNAAKELEFDKAARYRDVLFALKANIKQKTN